MRVRWPDRGRRRAGELATTIVETSNANLDGGDRDSGGLYQQRDTWGTFAQRTKRRSVTSPRMCNARPFLAVR